ncbi:hypothetical protein ACQ86N_35000 [Puia sp. P3]|uniref:hypothetical protein n=1 Tax=Puia sp. P3 TaxID=3423952 RepID=UPI003D6728B8
MKSSRAASLIFSSVEAFWLGSVFEDRLDLEGRPAFAGRRALEAVVFLVVLFGVLAIACLLPDYRTKVDRVDDLNKLFNQMIK